MDPVCSLSLRRYASKQAFRVSPIGHFAGWISVLSIQFVRRFFTGEYGLCLAVFRCMVSRRADERLSPKGPVACREQSTIIPNPQPEVSPVPAIKLGNLQSFQTT